MNRTPPRCAAGLLATVLAGGMALIPSAPAAAAVPPAAATTQTTASAAAAIPAASSVEQSSSPAHVGLYRKHTAANGTELRYHSFDGGDKGLVVYFDGDGTDGFDTPRTGSSESNGAHGHVQRIRKAAAAEGFDLIFIDHPGGGESWWNGVDTQSVSSAVRDLVTASGASRVEFVGYSGGAEFLARHLLADDASWWPEHVGATMIGGGGGCQRTRSRIAKQDPCRCQPRLGDRRARFFRRDPVHHVVGTRLVSCHGCGLCRRRLHPRSR